MCVGKHTGLTVVSDCKTVQRCSQKRSETPWGCSRALCLSGLHIRGFSLKLRRVKLHQRPRRAETANQVSDWTLSGSQRHKVTVYKS